MILQIALGVILAGIIIYALAIVLGLVAGYLGGKRSDKLSQLHEKHMKEFNERNQ